MQLWHKFVSSQQDFLNDFIHLKLMIWKFLIFNKKVNFFLPQAVQFDKRINLSFSDNLIFIYSIFFTTDTIGFHWFLYYIDSVFFISFFVSLYSVKTLFIEIISSGLIYEWIETLKIRTSIVFNLSFSSSTVLQCFFFFFFIIDLYFLPPAVIA